MDKVIELTYELKKELDSLPLFQEYKRVKTLLDSSTDLKELKAKIVKADSKSKKQLLDEYNTHPLVVNYKQLEEEVRVYLQEICEIINKK